MTTSGLVRNRWETIEYTRIVSARFEDGVLLVKFADGEEARLPVDRFENPYIRAQAPDWSRVRAGTHEVIVPAADGDLGIPWDAIRALTDPEFEAHWAAMGRRVSSAVGKGLRRLRVARKLSLPELAQRTGVPDDAIEHLEAGDRLVDVDLTLRALRAMDCTLDDLSDER
jgi:hypothetical protein